MLRTEIDAAQRTGVWAAFFLQALIFEIHPEGHVDIVPPDHAFFQKYLAK